MKYQNENFRGVYDFRCNYHEGWVMETNLHEYSEILYCKKGNCYVTINGIKILLPEGHFIWIPPNYTHQYHSTDAKLICAVFSRDFIPLYFHMFKDKRIKTKPIEAGELKEVLDRFHLLKKEDFLCISGYLNLLCAKMAEQTEFYDNIHTDSNLYQKVITYLSSHFKEDIYLKSVARHFGYNEKYLSHTIHNLTGVSFRKLLNFYRVENAKLMFDEGETSISAVATESGFSALNSFNRIFKEFTGNTPSEYKRNKESRRNNEIYF